MKSISNYLESSCFEYFWTRFIVNAAIKEIHLETN